MKPNGFVFYRGPSMLDGKPIVAILTGIAKRSANSKTGSGLFQTWILREDINPIKAVNNGADVSICGDCKHQGTVVKARADIVIAVHGNGKAKNFMEAVQ